MARYILEILDEGEAELIAENSDETIWRSDEDDDFDDDPTDEEAVIDYLVRHEIVASENEIVEVMDETGEHETLDLEGDDEGEESDDD
ncbi:MAG: hypothetical protein AB7P97_20425 [Hyphomonadaceae bacterium]